MERFRYRAYILNKDNTIQLAVDLYCADDDRAQRVAWHLVDANDVELWRGQRKVARLTPNK